MNTYLIVGLGNPGIDYIKTRHNVGFMFVDFMSKESGNTQFSLEKKFDAQVSTILNENRKIIFAKPETYMNRSGESIIKLSQYFQISNDNIYIIHDDLDISIGEYKIQYTKGPRQHNGILSAETHLNTNEFFKVRIGIENRGDLRNKIPGKNYVLSNFTPEEKEILDNEVFPLINSELRSRLV